MLVLERKSNEEIVIGGNVFIKVLSIRRNSVTLGIEADRSVTILRAELIERKRPGLGERTLD